MGTRKETATYAMYRGEEFVDLGTISELEERTGLKRATLQWYASAVAMRRNKKGNRMILIKLDEEEEESV